jgi:hypothetical protein
MKTARSIPFDRLLQIRAPESLTDALDVAATRKMVNRSDYIRVALLGAPSGIIVNSVNGLNSFGNNFQGNVAGTVAQSIGSTVTSGTVGLNSKYGTFAASVNSAAGVTAVAPF